MEIIETHIKPVKIVEIPHFLAILTKMREEWVNNL